MKFKLKYKICLIKSYFDKGLGLTNYIKYFLGFFALASKDVGLTFLWASVYVVFCFFFGRWWFKSNFVRAEQEVSNKYNLFVGEMRKKIGKPNK